MDKSRKQHDVLTDCEQLDVEYGVQGSGSMKGEQWEMNLEKDREGKSSQALHTIGSCLECWSH